LIREPAEQSRPAPRILGRTSFDRLKLCPDFPFLVVLRVAALPVDSFGVGGCAALHAARHFDAVRS
jgi:hypothetical protein